MIPRGRSDRRALGLASLVPALLLLAGCSSSGNAPAAAGADASDPAAMDRPSTAADGMIEKAKSPEERRALEKARDEVDARMREKVRALDAEIERLRKENESLRQQAGR